MYVIGNLLNIIFRHFHPASIDALVLQQLEGTTPMERRVRRAAQCAFAIQDELHNCELAQEVRLSVKIGIGMGKVREGSRGISKGGRRAQYVPARLVWLRRWFRVVRALSRCARGQIDISVAKFTRAMTPSDRLSGGGQ